MDGESLGEALPAAPARGLSPARPTQESTVENEGEPKVSLPVAVPEVHEEGGLQGEEPLPRRRLQQRAARKHNGKPVGGSRLTARGEGRMRKWFH